MSLSDLFQTPAPDVAIEIDHTHVAAARLDVARQPGGDHRARQRAAAAGAGGARRWRR